MIKKIIIFSIIGTVIIASLAFAISGMSGESQPESTSESIESESSKADVIMPTKVSRPGCEIEDRCYIPSKITVEQGRQVTWVNEDSAFHSVTSGFYDAPAGLFDSGYLDPYESYSLTFDEPGTYDYYCTLHPWMEGQVIVE